MEAREGKPETTSTNEVTQSAAGEVTSGGRSNDSKPAVVNTAPAASGHSTESTPSKPTGTATRKAFTLDDASKEIAQLVSSKKINSTDLEALKYILKEHGSLKEKVDKLKSLLGRSAKAQREAKVDLEATQKRLSQALREIERLNQKLDKLQSRPTHRKLHIALSPS